MSSKLPRPAQALAVIFTIILLSVKAGGCLSSTKGADTPAPGPVEHKVGTGTPEPSSASPTQPTLTWTEAPRVQAELERRQGEADEGHRAGLLDAQDVAYDFVGQVLQVPGKLTLKETLAKDDGTIEVVIETTKGRLHLLIDRPVRRDATGILSVKSYAWEDQK